MRSKIDVDDLIYSIYHTESVDDFEELWNALVTLRDHGFISESDWSIFSKVCGDCYYDEDCDFVVNPYFV